MQGKSKIPHAHSTLNSYKRYINVQGVQEKKLPFMESLRSETQDASYMHVHLKHNH